ncbi:glycosyltransferase family 4 protein [Aneurinibacillus tyrosinisolvens]|uniref:glycosyltransferase family 4 protein n=1 Tax=Aneurinibacillus tyrosinisolvens TaxID=1443435 RepID=UPI00063F6FD6|nr:glycosyltransferase family 4 protein [Aneurinibacillus tyrosinisolvens]
MKIVYIITRSDWGGAQAHVFDLLRYACTSNKCYLIIGEEGILAERARELDIPVWIVPTLIQAIHPFYDVLAIHHIRRIIKNIRPDIVHAHSSKAGIVGRIAAWITGVPSIFTAHGWAFTDGVSVVRKKISIPMERLVAKLSTYIICVSEFDRQLALRYKVANEEQLVTVHNGITEQGMVSEHHNKDKTKIIMVARFSTQKDYRTLILTSAKLSSPVELFLVGEGELLESSRRLAVEQGVASKINFLGMRKDIPEILSACDVFVLTSHYEGFPISILEAMRAGLPVIASDVGGVKEAVVDGVTGYIVPREDVQAVRDRLETLAKNPKLRKQMGQAGRGRYLERFTSQQMVDKIFSLYWEALK